MMILAAVLSTGLVVSGLALSYEADLPAGATTILLAAAVYGLVQLGAALRRRHRSAR